MRVLPEAGIDPGLLAEWAAAWAVSRGKPGPVPVHNGFYLLDGRPGQIARYVFPDLRPKVVAAMTARITEPFVFLKWCAARDRVAALLPPGWEIASPGFMMSAAREVLDRPAAAPDGYLLSPAQDGEVIRLDILDRSGRSVAEGRLIVRGELAVFDRILVVEDHRRRGLGSAVMQALGAEALRSGAGQGLLVATPAGHALYRRLGWCLLSHYTSASRTA